jgi:hypothetical protein
MTKLVHGVTFNETKTSLRDAARAVKDAWFIGQRMGLFSGFFARPYPLGRGVNLSALSQEGRVGRKHRHL